MSLIADALKAAQKEKARRAPPPRAAQQPGYFPFRFPTRGSGEPMVSPMIIGVGVAGAAIALVALVLVFSPSQKPETRPPAVAQFPDSVSSTMVLEPPGDTSGLALLDTMPPDASERLDVAMDEYVDEPPPRAVPRPSGRTSRPSPAPVDDSNNSAPLPSIVASTPPRNSESGGGRLQITVDRPAQGSQGSGLFEQGLAAQRRGDYETAKNRYLQATYDQPRNLELWNNLGTVYRALKDLSGAEGAFRTATEIDRAFAPAWSNLGIVLAQQGRAQEAMTALQEAVRLDPANIGAKVNLAIQLHAAGAIADARSLLEEAVRADPAMAEAHYELGRVLEKANDRAGAIREYRIFLSTAGGRFPALEQAVRSRLVRLEP